MQAQRLIVAFQAAREGSIPLPELSAAEIQGWALTEAIAASDDKPKGLLKVAGAGLLTGVLTALLPLDNALDLDLTSFLYPVWQACVALGLATALRRTRSSLDVND